MGAVDLILFTLLALADTALMVHLRRRRARRLRSERMLRSLRAAIEREAGGEAARMNVRPALVPERAS